MAQNDTPTPMRADARRNREKLLKAATEVFAEAGPDASLEAVAKRASVGAGTLYRHFPTRDDLIEAAYRNEVELLTGSVDELLAEYPPDRALEEWAKRFIAYAETKRGMSRALQAVIASGRDPYAATRGKLRDAIGALLEAGAAAGVLRGDVEADDVVLSLGGISMLPESDDWAERAERVIGLVIDGLRYGA